MLCCVQVTVNGVDYQPQTASPNKKHAKAMAATVALQALGEVHSNNVDNDNNPPRFNCYFTVCVETQLQLDQLSVDW